MEEELPSEPSIDISTMTPEELTAYALENWVNEDDDETQPPPSSSSDTPNTTLTTTIESSSSSTSSSSSSTPENEFVEIEDESSSSNSHSIPVLDEDDLKGTRLEKYVSKNKTYTSTVKIDIVGDLPNELALQILSYLDANSLLKGGTLSHRWKKLTDTKLLWWKHYNLMVWDADSQPKKMNRKDRKLNWKQKYLDLVRLPEVKNQVIRFEVEFEETGPTKHEMRQHYKSIRSNPKGKKPKRGGIRGALGEESFDEYFYAYE